MSNTEADEQSADFGTLRVRSCCIVAQRSYGVSLPKRLMRDDERQAFRSLDKLLRLAGERPRWSPGTEPPDLWLRLHGRRFAVEITQVQREIHRGSYRGSESHVDAALTAFLRRVTERAFADDIIRGCYSVRMAPVEHFRSVSAIIQERLRSFFVESRSASTTDEVHIWGRAWGARWTARKVDARDAIVFPHIDFYGIPPWRGDVYAILADRIAERLARKTAKLAHIATPKILVLVDAMYQPDDDQWAQALSELAPARWHTIVRTGGSNRARIFRSAETRWLMVD